MSKFSIRSFLSKLDLKANDLPEPSYNHLSTTLQRQFETYFNNKTSLLNALLLTFKYKLLLTGFLSCCQMICTFAMPLIMQQFLIWYSRMENPVTGILPCTFMILVTVTGQCIMSNCFQFYIAELAMDVRTVLYNQVVKKTLQNGMGCLSTGQLFSILTSGLDKISLSIQVIHNVWYITISLTISALLLYRTAGNASFVSLIWFFFLIICQIAFIMITVQAYVKIAPYSEARLNMTSEIIKGIKSIKLCSWGNAYEKKMKLLRDNELTVIGRFFFVNACNNTWMLITPLSLIICTYISFNSLSGPMKPDCVFTSLSILGIMCQQLSSFAFTVQSIAAAKIILHELTSYMNSSSKTINRTDCELNCNAIEIQGTFTWDANCVENVDIEKMSNKVKFELCVSEPLSIKQGELVAIIGAIGSGKSSLLSAMMGAMTQKNARCSLNGSIGLADQTPWLTRDTVKNNILMGLPFDEEKFRRVLEASALIGDFQSLPQRLDNSVGIEMSGGQKSRVSLARVLYAEPDIAFLEDPLSAVDSRVGQHIFNEGIKKALSGKTVVFTTNQLFLLKSVDKIIIIQDGQISEWGTYDNLYDKKKDFYSLMNEYGGLVEENDDCVIGFESFTSNSIIKRRLVSICDKAEMVNRRRVKRINLDKLITTKNLTVLKHRDVYRSYFANSASFVFLSFIFSDVVKNYQDYMMSVWTQDKSDAAYQNHFRSWYLLGITACILCPIKLLCLARYSFMVSISMYEDLFDRVLHSKIEFFDTISYGEIMNRFSVDLYSLDVELPKLILQSTLSVLVIVSGFLKLGFRLPILFTVIVPVMCYLFHIQQLYRPFSRKLTNIKSETTGDMLTFLTECLNGARTITAFRMEEVVAAETHRLQDIRNRSIIMRYNADSWLQMQLEITMSIFMTVIYAFVLLCMQSILQPLELGAVGFCISHGNTIAMSLKWTVQVVCFLDAKMTCVGRIRDLGCKESKEINDLYRPTNIDVKNGNWVKNGDVEFKNLSLRYREGLPLVLKNVSFKITGGSKVGVIGRTGSGKSSLIVALFRLTEPTLGSGLFIDDFDCLKCGLADLRSAVSIIPQDPILILGTVRSNIDPYDCFSDDRIWHAIIEVGLDKVIDSLQDDVIEGGMNFSSGYRQLFCLVRALLRETHILVLDEATANVDPQTCERLQILIRKNFSTATVITIAHRLSTVADSDYILVMDEGSVAEFDKPENLKRDEHSLYVSLLKSENTR